MFHEAKVTSSNSPSPLLYGHVKKKKCYLFVKSGDIHQVGVGKYYSRQSFNNIKILLKNLIIF
jgi:hypothetical protein